VIDFKNGIIKIPIMSNISSKLSGVSNLNFERISPIQFNPLISSVVIATKSSVGNKFAKNVPLNVFANPLGEGILIIPFSKSSFNF